SRAHEPRIHSYLRSSPTRRSSDLDTHTNMLGEWYSTKNARKRGMLVPILEPENSPTLRQFRYWYINKYSKYDRYSNIEGKRKARSEEHTSELQSEKLVCRLLLDKN